MRAVNSKGAQLREKINQMQTHSQQLGQQAHLEQAGFAAYRLREHQESSAKIAALRDAMQRDNADKTAIFTDLKWTGRTN